MRKIILYSAASIDNFIAKKDGNIEWLHSPEYITPGEDYGYKDFYNSVDTTLMGNKTFKIINGFDMPFPYPDKKNYVFSSQRQVTGNNHVTFVNDDIENFVSSLKETEGKDIWLVGGGQINAYFLDHGLIDQMILTVIPVVLGSGIPLFGKANVETGFSLDHSKIFGNKCIQLFFSKSDQKG